MGKRFCVSAVMTHRFTESLGVTAKYFNTTGEQILREAPRVIEITLRLCSATDGVIAAISRTSGGEALYQLEHPRFEKLSHLPDALYLPESTEALEIDVPICTHTRSQLSASISTLKKLNRYIHAPSIGQAFAYSVWFYLQVLKRVRRLGGCLGVWSEQQRKFYEIESVAKHAPTRPAFIGNTMLVNGGIQN